MRLRGLLSRAIYAVWRNFLDVIWREVACAAVKSFLPVLYIYCESVLVSYEHEKPRCAFVYDVLSHICSSFLDDVIYIFLDISLKLHLVGVIIFLRNFTHEFPMFESEEPLFFLLFVNVIIV